VIAFARPALPGHGAVVIGGSAGSLPALLTIVSRLPAGFSLATIVVVHLPPGAPSGLARALAPVCALPVAEPLDKEPVRPGQVHLASPGYHLLVEPGPRFAFSLDEPVNYARPSIDVLFQAAAEVYGSRLIGVVLSGANNDGSEGLASIHRAGGQAFVQSPEDASSPQMPDAALAACPAARPLSAAGIAAQLVAAHRLHSDPLVP
jgi:two-component system chemotaxis response regulator CheB